MVKDLFLCGQDFVSLLVVCVRGSPLPFSSGIMRSMCRGFRTMLGVC